MFPGLQGEVRAGGRRFNIRVNLDNTFTVLEWVWIGQQVGEWRLLPLSHRLHPFKSDWSAYLAGVMAIERYLSILN